MKEETCHSDRRTDLFVFYLNTHACEKRSEEKKEEGLQRETDGERDTERKTFMACPSDSLATNDNIPKLNIVAYLVSLLDQLCATWDQKRQTQTY